MSVRNHYGVLGVQKKSSQEEIKAAFRKLSLETHPDLNQENDGEEFKVIAEAHSILSSPRERMKYDRQLLDASMWRRPSPTGGGFYDGDNIRRPGARPPPRGLHVAMQTLSNPRYLALGLVAFGSLAALLESFTSKRPDVRLHGPGAAMIQAWHNPKTKRWEQPAPWDPLYRQLKPQLKFMPREKVQRRNMQK
jgi:curved DNA-binding protein CbpA